jgi:Cd2+/Zn2+-exporting ATPase
MTVRYLLPGAQPVFCALFVISARIVERTAGDAAALPLHILAYLAGGTGSAITAWAALRARRVDVNLLMLVAALGAATIGRWDEGGVLLFLFSLSNAMEFYALGRTRRAIRALMELRPAAALVRRGGDEVVVPVEDLRVGDVVVVRPAERLPADGIVRHGASSVDQSSITGESMPVDVGPGSQVFAGTINQRGSLDVHVTKEAEDTTLARIIALVEKAQSAQAPSQRLIDRFGGIYAIGVIAAAIVTYGVFTLLGFASAAAFYRAITLLVVASPCALVIATPATVLSAIANAARHGILFKGGAHIERLADVKTIVFDKTGTLTVGRPVVTDVIPLAGTEEALLLMAGSIEQRSEHALAEAVVAACREHRLDLQEPQGFESVTGRGVRGTVAGRTVRVGSEQFMRDEGVSISDSLAVHLSVMRQQGKVPILVANERLIGILGVADVLRPQAGSAIRALRALGIARIIVLTGDHHQVAEAVAGRLEVDDIRADLLPDQKADVVRALTREGAVAMVGDGVNDAPAMATADVGVAMGAAGTDAALETADLVLMGDDLHRLPEAIQLSRQARRVIKQNLAFAGAVIAVLITLTIALGLRLALGVVGHEGSTVLVVLNGLRLLRFRPTQA